MIPRRYSGSTSKHRDLSNRVYADYEDRMVAMAKAEKLDSELGSDYPTLVKTMLKSHVTGGFWLVGILQCAYSVIFYLNVSSVFIRNSYTVEIGL